MFDNPAIPTLIVDEAAPVGGDAGTNPGRILAPAVVNCVATSLLFAMRKFKNEPGQLRATASVGTARNEQKRWRIVSIDVERSSCSIATAPSSIGRELARPRHPANPGHHAPNALRLARPSATRRIDDLD